MKFFPKCHHYQTPDNTYVHPQKGPQCRTCIREYQATYMRETYRPARKAER